MQSPDIACYTSKCAELPSTTRRGKEKTNQSSKKQPTNQLYIGNVSLVLIECKFCLLVSYPYIATFLSIKNKEHYC